MPKDLFATTAAGNGRLLESCFEEYLHAIYRCFTPLPQSGKRCAERFNSPMDPRRPIQPNELSISLALQLEARLSTANAAREPPSPSQTESAAASSRASCPQLLPVRSRSTVSWMWGRTKNVLQQRPWLCCRQFPCLINLRSLYNIYEKI